MAPESESVPATSEVVGLRTHPLSGVVQGGIWALAASAGLFWSFFDGDVDGGAVLGIIISVALGLLFGLAFGFLQWNFTRYVIDGRELRITSGIITKKSRRVSYDRLQSIDIAEPLLARIFGLAELRIETAGGKDSRTALQYLKLNDAHQLRKVLLDKAHGISAVDGATPPAEEHRSLITAVPPSRLIIGTVLSLDFLFALTGAAALLIAAVAQKQYVAVLGGVFPLAFWLFQIVLSRVIQQWNFTLTRGERGLRIERGLLSRTSQTIPFERVQGIAIKEPFVWRRLGWQRLEVDIAGYANTGSDSSSGTDSSSTLLPITDPALARALIGEVIPGSEPVAADPLRATRRSMVFAPIGWKYRWVAANERTFTAHEGWIEAKTSIVPHHKTQSVELRQGPLARWRDVATVEVHTPKGPVNADGRNLDGIAARQAAITQLAHARAARH